MWTCCLCIPPRVISKCSQRISWKTNNSHDRRLTRKATRERKERARQERMAVDEAERVEVDKREREMREEARREQMKRASRIVFNDTDKVIPWTSLPIQTWPYSQWCASYLVKIAGRRLLELLRLPSSQAKYPCNSYSLLQQLFHWTTSRTWIEVISQLLREAQWGEVPKWSLDGNLDWFA